MPSTEKRRQRGNVLPKDILVHRGGTIKAKTRDLRIHNRMRCQLSYNLSTLYLKEINKRAKQKRVSALFKTIIIKDPNQTCRTTFCEIEYCFLKCMCKKIFQQHQMHACMPIIILQSYITLYKPYLNCPGLCTPLFIEFIAEFSRMLLHQIQNYYIEIFKLTNDVKNSNETKYQIIQCHLIIT